MRHVWTMLRTGLVRALSIPLALLLLFEEWGWRPLAAALAYLARLRIVARLEGLIGRLPPYPALAVFALPSALLFPVKVLGLYLLAKGQLVAAGALIAAAKVVSTALVARLFLLTKPALMRLGWFARAYGWFVPWKEALFAVIRASWAWRYGRVVKERARRMLRRVGARLAPMARSARATAVALTRRAVAWARLVWRRGRGPRAPGRPDPM